MSCGRYVVGGAECAVGVQPAHLILIEQRAVPELVPEWALRHVERAVSNSVGEDRGVSPN